MIIIFDADGTLTPMRRSATGSAIFELLPGVGEKCLQLRAEGHTLAIASNQSPQRPRWEIIQQLDWTRRAIGAACVRWATTASRRKPRPAMIFEILREFDADLDEALFVGDRESDREAAEAAGIEFVWAGEFFEYTENE